MCRKACISLAVRPKILLHWKNLCITSLQRVRLRVVPIFPQGQYVQRAQREREYFSLSPRHLSPSSRRVIFTRARVSLAPLSLRKNGDYSQSNSLQASYVQVFRTKPCNRMFGLLIEYLALTGINTITQRVNAEPGWISSFEKGQDKARRKYYSDYCYSCVNTTKTSVLLVLVQPCILS